MPPPAASTAPGGAEAATAGGTTGGGGGGGGGGSGGSHASAPASPTASVEVAGASVSVPAPPKATFVAVIPEPAAAVTAPIAAPEDASPPGFVLGFAFLKQQL